MVSPLLVFDLDGTLADSAPDLLGALETVLPKHGINVAVDRSYREGIGHGARYLIEYALKRQGSSFDKSTVDAIHRDFLVHYQASISVGTRLFPGTERMLDRFAAEGWTFAVCTNKPVGMSQLLLHDLGIAERFAAICGGDSFSRRKPDPAHLLETIAAAGGETERAVMIGDSETDLDTARGAGVPFVGVSFGYTPVPMAALRPDILVNHFDEITPERLARLLVNLNADAAPIRLVPADAP